MIEPAERATDTEPLAVASGSCVQLPALGKTKFASPKIELLTRLLPQAVLYRSGVARSAGLVCFLMSSSVSSVVKSQFPPGAVIDGVSLIDCIFRGVRAIEVVEASGSILFRNVKIEPAEKGRSLNSRPTWP